LSIEKRLKYCEDHLKDKFSNICFTDESVFQLSDNRQCVWWRSSSMLKQKIQSSNNKSKVMAWGGMSRRGLTGIYFWKRRSDSYCRRLQQMS